MKILNVKLFIYRHALVFGKSTLPPVRQQVSLLMQLDNKQNL